MKESVNTKNVLLFGIGSGVGSYCVTYSINHYDENAYEIIACSAGGTKQFAVKASYLRAGAKNQVSRYVFSD